MKLSNYQQTSRKVTQNSKKQKVASKKAKSASKKGKNSNGVSFWKFLKSKRMVQVYGILLMAFAVLLCISMFSSYFHFRSDASHVGAETVPDNAAGTVGAHLAYYFIYWTFGFFSIGFVLLFFIYGFKLTFERAILPPFLTTLTTLITMAWLSTVFGCFLADSDYNFVSGAFGNETSKILIEHTHNWGAGLILFALFIIILILFYNISPKKMIEVIAGDEEAREKRRLRAEERRKEKGERRKEKGERRKGKKEKEEGRKFLLLSEEKVADGGEPPDDGRGAKLPELYIEDINSLRNEYETKAEFKIVSDPIEELEDLDKSEQIELTTNDETANEISPSNFEGVSGEAGRGSLHNTPEPDFPLEDYDPRLDLSLYKFPNLDLLNNYEIKEIDKEALMAELQENADKIQTTLKHFDISIKEISVTRGPTVTLYEIVPADGIRISKIKNLEDDIALNLAAQGIRIIAPIPGKGTIGIEVPNKNAQLVSMREIIDSDKFQNNEFDLPIGLGKTISNKPFVVDLAKMPHLLMAGATGQGKSVGLNAILTSLLYKKHPSELKFVLIDPKRVELTLYSVIENHYLAKLPDADNPIVTETKKIVQTLNSLCVEMDTRLGLLNLAKVRGIKEYNQKFCARKLSPALGHRYLPYIVLIIDEFADLIMTAGKDVEMPIARLAQLARAIGIHLIIATQRPSVNIITGSIKANFPARLAFRVVQKVDSRTILDANGADRLIGKGDMLLSTGSDLIRLQCAFVDTPEVEKIALHIEEQQAYPEPFLLPEYIMAEKGKGSSSEDDFIDTGEIDQMFMEAATLIVQTQMGSTSLIQRKMKLGYNRAGRVMDQLEEFGIVGPSMGSKAREVKVRTNEELMQVFQKMGLF
ncbi:MAG: DNA translocase FtsK [Lentimicrobiaceae bacterium]|nr:DNA translocase FtsK [Lentimicrobiaceae bacterium]